MITTIAETCIVILGSLAAAPAFGSLVVVSCQVLLIAAAGFLITRRIYGRYAAEAHRIWLTAIVLTASLIPAHLLVGGWPIRVSTPVSEMRLARVDSFDSAATDLRAELITAEVEPPTDQPLIGQPSLVVRNGSTANNTLPATAAMSVRQQAESATRVDRTPHREITSESALTLADLTLADHTLGWIRHQGTLVAAIVYLTGCLTLVVRLVIGAIRLRRWSRSGREAGDQVLQEAIASTAEVGLSRVPAVRVIEQSAMPLVFGCWRPVVLVPSDFETWTLGERRATLMHEFMHIHRRDVIGQLMCHCMCAAYWFHPAAWFMKRRLTEAREWATDRQLVDNKIDAREYAETLLNIVSRMDKNRAPTPWVQPDAIAMSSPGAIEIRLRRLLQSPSQRSIPLRLSAPIAISMLMLLVAATTVRVERVAAQTDVTAATATESSAQRAEDEHDLFARIRDCDVLTVTGDQFDAIFTVDGVVLSDAGQPVAGAIVLLRESSTARLSSESSKYGYASGQGFLRTPDVFARTTTDAAGRFEFREVKSPPLPKAWSNSWRGNLVAAHKELGVGWLSLGDKKEKRRVDTNITLVLKPTTTVSGRYVSPKETVIDKASVTLNRLVKPNGRPTRPADFDLQRSQLTPKATTSADGKFKFTRVPVGFIATVNARDDESLGGYGAIATSDDVPLGIQRDMFSYLDGFAVSRSPAVVKADPGVAVSGQVRDPDGRPVADAKVSLASTVTSESSDDRGEFELRIPTRWIDRERERGNSNMKLYIAPTTESSLLPRYWEVPIEDLTGVKPIAIELEEGAIVRGKVVTETGQPISAARLILAANYVYAGRISQGITDTDGHFEMVLPKQRHTIIVTTEEPGYAVPNRAAIRNADKDVWLKWPHCVVDLTAESSVEIPAIVVPKVRPLQVIVSLPDGEPAKGATAIIKDEIAQKIPADSRFVRPPRIIDQSEPVMTDPIGRAELFPKGKLTDRAKVHVKLSTPDKAFDAQIPTSVAVNGVLKVILQSGALLEGRVLIDGQPVAGAKVSIGESTPLRASGSGGYPMGFQVSNHIQAMTDRDGWYRAAVSRDKVYSVSIQSMPNDSARPGIGYQPEIVGDGKLRVRDFAFYRGDREITGRVVDRQGAPIPAANVQILGSASASPDLWINHMRDSQFDTDQLGRFHLKHIPAGTYPLRISGPRNESTRNRVATMMTVEAGTTGVEISLDMRPVETIPRLQPVRIVPIETSESAP